MAVKFKDYYELLGVDRKASQKDIQKAFRRLARKWHPDVNKAAEAEARFKELNEAYEVLKDPEKRRLYDSLGPNWQAGQNFRPPPGFDNIHFDFGGGGQGGGGAFSDFFEMLFGGGLGSMGGRRPRQQPGFSGFQGFSPFGDSMGGFGGPQAAPRRPQRPKDTEAEITVTLEDVYHGATKKMTLESNRGARTYDVTIPPGISEGAKIRLSGQGAGGGHLLLKVHIAKHKTFELKKHDLYVEVPVAPWEAVLGGKVEVPTLDGTVKMTVPAGTQGGKKLRLKGKGLPQRGGKRGNLFAVLVIQIPKEISEEERKLYEKLAELSSRG